MQEKEYNQFRTVKCFFCSYLYTVDVKSKIISVCGSDVFWFWSRSHFSFWFDSVSTILPSRTIFGSRKFILKFFHGSHFIGGLITAQRSEHLGKLFRSLLIRILNTEKYSDNSRIYIFTVFEHFYTSGKVLRTCFGLINVGPFGAHLVGWTGIGVNLGGGGGEEMARGASW